MAISSPLRHEIEALNWPIDRPNTVSERGWVFICAFRSGCSMTEIGRVLRIHPNSVRETIVTARNAIVRYNHLQDAERREFILAHPAFSKSNRATEPNLGG